MNIEAHQHRIKESIEVLEECVKKDIVERQRTIGFNASAAAVDFLEVYLHQLGLIDPGLTFKHNWFTSSKNIAKKLPFEFPQKHDILDCLLKIESKRNLLCGKPQKAELIEEVLLQFNRIKELCSP